MDLLQAWLITAFALISPLFAFYRLQQTRRVGDWLRERPHTSWNLELTLSLSGVMGILMLMTAPIAALLLLFV